MRPLQDDDRDVIKVLTGARAKRRVGGPFKEAKIAVAKECCVPLADFYSALEPGYFYALSEKERVKIGYEHLMRQNICNKPKGFITPFIWKYIVWYVIKWIILEILEDFFRE